MADDAKLSTMPHLAFGQEDRDQCALRRALELGLTVTIECRSRRRVSQMILLDLAKRYGVTTTLGELVVREKGLLRSDGVGRDGGDELSR